MPVPMPVPVVRRPPMRVPDRAHMIRRVARVRVGLRWGQSGVVLLVLVLLRCGHGQGHSDVRRRERGDAGGVDGGRHARLHRAGADRLLEARVHDRLVLGRDHERLVIAVPLLWGWNRGRGRGMGRGRLDGGRERGRGRGGGRGRAETAWRGGAAVPRVVAAHERGRRGRGAVRGREGVCGARDGRGRARGHGHGHGHRHGNGAGIVAPRWSAVEVVRGSAGVRVGRYRHRHD